MQKLSIKYEMEYEFDEQDASCITEEMEYLADDYPDEEEKDLFDSALYNVLRGFGVSNDEIDQIIEGDNFDTIYKWWKENK